MSTKSDIHVYGEGTPNGLKISIALEELGLPYRYRTLDFTKLEQKEEWFLKINPNGRIPAIVDKSADGQELEIFESGAILQYLVATYDKTYRISYPAGSKEHWETTSWVRWALQMHGFHTEAVEQLMWQVSGIGPILGQANHFTRFTYDTHKYATDRYVNESRRLFRVLDGHLAGNSHGYLVGDRVTIADISIWPWVAAYRFCGLPSLEEFPHVVQWFEKLIKRPGFEKGRNVPVPHRHIQFNTMSDEEMNAVAAGGREWIAKLMKRDAEV